MLSPRFVLDYVARRYGKLQPILFKEHEKLSLVKNGIINLTDLESDRDRVRKRIARESDNPEIGLERINNINNLQDKFIVDKLALMGRAVCRILDAGAPLGTGFLISDDIVITNHHVISSATAGKSMIAEFDFELAIDQVPKKSALFRLNPDKFFLSSSLEASDGIPFSGLDFTMIGVEKIGINKENIDQYPPLFLDGNKGKIIKGESCVIIQHPNGLPKKIVLKDISFFFETDTRLVYESDTMLGSSGSVVIGLGTCEVVALHHSALPRTNSSNQILTKQGTVVDENTTDEEIDWIGNEGIKISKIIEALIAADLPPAMQSRKDAILQNTQVVAAQLHDSEIRAANKEAALSSSPVTPVTAQPVTNSNSHTMPISSTTLKQDFIIVATNKSAVVQNIERILRIRYSQPVALTLVMPSAAQQDVHELFSFSIPFNGDVNDEAQELTKIPGILNAEPDVPLALNTDIGFDPLPRAPGTESSLVDDGLGRWDEPDFLDKYKTSPYVKGARLDQIRKWNWAATGFDGLTAPRSPVDAGIRIVQFDTGFTDHPKVKGGFDIDQDFNFITNVDNASDPLTTGLAKNPGHGTRTASLLIGVKPIEDPEHTHNGNEGLLSSTNYKLVPYRIAESVILINRQQQLAAALDRAIAQGFDIITMSMGLPPTISTSKMAKTAYDRGVIWCCAAGNEVQAVIAPAVFPGTIAVAASNPFDFDWKGSSRGDAVDITAPGEDVYVPILNKDRLEDYAYGNGTSYATPHIAAAAAYWLAAHQDKLNTPEYSGWKRVEAFKQALKESGRRENNLPRKGFGHGMLDMKKLLKTKPVPANQLKYAYNKWNENAFLDSLQAYGELLKTYWNKIHDLFVKTKRGGQESLIPQEATVSNRSKILELELFGDYRSATESIAASSTAELIGRYNSIQNRITETL